MPMAAFTLIVETNPGRKLYARRGTVNPNKSAATAYSNGTSHTVIWALRRLRLGIIFPYRRGFLVLGTPLSCSMRPEATALGSSTQVNAERETSVVPLGITLVAKDGAFEFRSTKQKPSRLGCTNLCP